MNDVTRVLERMPPIDVNGSSPGCPLMTTHRFRCQASPVEIQVTFPPILLGYIGMQYLALSHSLLFRIELLHLYSSLSNSQVVVSDMHLSRPMFGSSICRILFVDEHFL